MGNQQTGHPIVCFGEILWDALPAGLFPGGAPMNVAYHLEKLGATAAPVSAVGKDFLGEDFLRRFRSKGIDTRFVAELTDWPTGVVVVELDEQGKASYDFREGMAWDHIPVTEKILETTRASTALLFGTLALRSQSNREALDQLITAAEQGGARKVFDVNFRPPHDDMNLAAELACRADWIKLNDDELEGLVLHAGLQSSLQSSAQSETSIGERLKNDVKRASDKMNIPRSTTWCVTAGADGAGLMHEGNWYWAEGRPIQVKDTVGAGDSFLAALLYHTLVRGEAPEQALIKACRTGEFVASQSGATPDYDPSDIPSA